MAGSLCRVRGLVLVFAIGIAGCQFAGATPTTDPSDVVRAEPEPDALPRSLEQLGLSATQRKQLKTLIANLTRGLESAKAQRDIFRGAMVSAARRCSADDSRLHIEAGRMVEAGNGVRPHVLDTLNELHRILTPKQRAELVDPVLTGAKGLGEDTDDGREEGLGKIAEKLDLDFIQKVQLIKRAVSRFTVSTADTRAIRDDALEAAKAFKRSDFDVRNHAIAKAPVIKLYTRFVLDLAQVVLPVLSEEQCTIGAGLLRRVFRKRDARGRESKREPKPSGDPTRSTPTNAP